jgi:predicted N-acetyltransferase YhbS
MVLSWPRSELRSQAGKGVTGPDPGGHPDRVSGSSGTRVRMIAISPANPEDAAAILEVQKRAFEAEARSHGDWDIPPLAETLETLVSQINSARVLKATDGPRVVGSIRGLLDGEVCTVQRLSVDLDYRGQGLGSALLNAIERCHAEASCFELITVSEANLRFYIRHGYEAIARTPYTERITLIRMRKRTAATGA